MTRTTYNWPVIFFTALVIAVGGAGMTYKMSEFAMTIVKDDIAGFGAVALSVYAAGTLPLLFLSLWGFGRGHFRNMEQPKYRMLELDTQIERRGNIIPPA